MTLVDSNILLDVFSGGQPWMAWSKQQLERATLRGSLIINDVIYAEISVQFTTVESLDDVLKEILVDVVSTPRPALFLAGKAFLQYRAAGGQRTGVLSDFLIGAHAAVQNIPILTRDARRYRHYFPTVELIAPEADQV
jgi:predicted nucleic acid-binding protein